MQKSGAKGYMGCGPTRISTQASDVRGSLVVRRLARVRTSGACRTSIDSARVDLCRTSGAWRSLVVHIASEIHRFGSGMEVSVVRRGPDVRSLEVVGSPGFIGHLEPGEFEKYFFLYRELGVLTVLSVECSWSAALLQAPDHT